MLKLNLHVWKKFQRAIRRHLLILCCLAISLIVTLGVLISSLRDSGDSYSNYDMIEKRDGVFYKGCIDTEQYMQAPGYEKMNASFVMLTRNEEVKEVLKTMHSIETHFNQWFQYPYIFLNNEPFTADFKRQISSMTKANVTFGTLEESEWEFPKEVREKFAFQNAIQEQGDRAILYANMESYHKMCRFYSGIFYKHPLVKQNEWYWRIEPDVEFFCDITYDPFYEMAKADKKYGFTVLIPEIYWSVPNLFRYTRSFIRQNNVTPRSLWSLFVSSFDILKTDNEELSQFVNHGWDVEPKISQKVAIDHMLETEDFEDDLGMEMLISRSRSKPPTLEDKFDNQEYNLCHFWSNFEIARLDVFDNDFYNSYFEFLEKSGGFWRERWGDAPIHSLGLGMMLNVEDIHYFRDIGYRHSDVRHCPKNWNGFQDGSKVSDGQLPYHPNEQRFSRKSFPWSAYDQGTEKGSGCRCKCGYKREVEDTASDCMNVWADLIACDDSYFESAAFSPYIDAKQLESNIKHDYLSNVHQ